jgi:hypothetical protein
MREEYLAKRREKGIKDHALAVAIAEHLPEWTAKTRLDGDGEPYAEELTHKDGATVSIRFGGYGNQGRGEVNASQVLQDCNGEQVYKRYNYPESPTCTFSQDKSPQAIAKQMQRAALPYAVELYAVLLEQVEGTKRRVNETDAVAAKLSKALGRPLQKSKYNRRETPKAITYFNGSSHRVEVQAGQDSAELELRLPPGVACKVLRLVVKEMNKEAEA